MNGGGRPRTSPPGGLRAARVRRGPVGAWARDRAACWRSPVVACLGLVVDGDRCRCQTGDARDRREFGGVHWGRVGPPTDCRAADRGGRLPSRHTAAGPECYPGEAPPCSTGRSITANGGQARVAFPLVAVRPGA